MKDYYKILESSFDDTQETIKANYRRLCKKWHPDKNKSQDATKMMQEIIEAYEILGNPTKRTRYNQAYFKSSYSAERVDSTYTTDWQSNLEQDIQDAQRVAQTWLDDFISDFKKRGNRAKSAAWEETKKQVFNLIVIIVLMNLLGLLLFMCSR